jgi:hypothetical protein
MRTKKSNGAGHSPKSGALSTIPAAHLCGAGAGGTWGGAGSVDASEHPVAIAATPPVAAGADRDANADLAEPEEGKRPSGAKPASSSAAKIEHARTPSEKPGAARETESTPANVPPGLEPLPEDAEAYVDAVHSQVDLVQLEVKLLNSRDEKVVQRELACLRELRYGKRAPEPGDEPPEIIFDIPRPQRTQ